MKTAQDSQGLLGLGLSMGFPLNRLSSIDFKARVLGAYILNDPTSNIIRVGLRLKFREDEREAGGAVV